MSDFPLAEVLGKIAAAQRGRPEVSLKAASLANLQGLLEGSRQPKFEIGDIVVLRPWAHNRFKWPKADERCIVTQALAAPVHSGDDGTPAEGKPKDIALAFIDSDGDVLEFLHDSRMFMRVGSIYDPVRLPDGEQVAVI